MGVKISRGNQAYRKHHNQVQERLHGTLKSLLRSKLGIKHAKRGWSKFSAKPLGSARDLITSVIEDYNNKYHRTLGASPNLVESALAVYGNGTSELATRDSKAGKEIERFRAEVIAKYAGDWQSFFIDWYFTTTKSHRETQSLIKSSAKANF